MQRLVNKSAWGYFTQWAGWILVYKDLDKAHQRSKTGINDFCLSYQPHDFIVYMVVYKMNNKQ